MEIVADSDVLLSKFGRNSIQIVISKIVDAVKRGDEDAITCWDAVLRAIDSRLDEDHDARVTTSLAEGRPSAGNPDLR